MMISNPSTLNGDTLHGKQNGKLHENNTNDEEEDTRHYEQINQIKDLKKKLIQNGIVNTLKRSGSYDESDDGDEHVQQIDIEGHDLKKLKTESDENLMPINDDQDLFKDKLVNKKKLNFIKLKQLEQSLRNEEAKFILLKRLFYSQKSTPSSASASAQPTSQRPVNGQVKPQQPAVQQPQQQQQQQQHQQQQPKPQAQIPQQKTIQPSVANKPMPPKPGQPTRPPTATPVQPLQNSASSSSLNKQPVNRVNTNSPLVTKNPSPSPSSAFSPIPNEPKKPNAQTHALVNQLVRKEFEKSLQLLEFPPKNPNLTPAQQQQIFQDIYFLPNANSPDFLMCLGLEEVVRCVQEHLNNKQQYKEQKEKKEQQQQAATIENQSVDDQKIVKDQIEIRYEYPYICAQCSTDWTPVWRTDRNGVVLCEKCLRQIEKKQIKQEHSAKLKQLFVKAQKDKEVFEKQVLSEQNSQPTQVTQAAPKPAPQVVTQSTPKQQVNNANQNRPNQSTPSNQQQKQFMPNNRPSPIQQRPSPVQQKPPQNISTQNRPVQNQNARNVNQNVPKQNQQKEAIPQQRQRTSTTGGLGVNFSSPLLGQNSVKSNASSSNLSNLSSQFNFSGLPSAVALAALAQQQQQQQQLAAFSQLLQSQQTNNLFNLPAGLTSTAALNYLNMLSSPANQNGKQWKNS